MNSLEQSVEDLAMALGLWIGSGGTSLVQEECFVESIIVLAFGAGIKKEDALRPFDIHRKTAAKVWNELEATGVIRCPR